MPGKILYAFEDLQYKKSKILSTRAWTSLIWTFKDNLEISKWDRCLTQDRVDNGNWIWKNKIQFSFCACVFFSIIQH